MTNRQVYIIRDSYFFKKLIDSLDEEKKFMVINSCEPSLCFDESDGYFIYISERGKDPIKILINKGTELEALAMYYINNYDNFILRENSSENSVIRHIINTQKRGQNFEFLGDLIYYNVELKDMFDIEINTKEEARKLIMNVMGLFEDVPPEDREEQASRVIENKKCYQTPHNNDEDNMKLYANIAVDAMINLLRLAYNTNSDDKKLINPVINKMLIYLMDNARFKISKIKGMEGMN